MPIQKASRELKVWDHGGSCSQ